MAILSSLVLKVGGFLGFALRLTFMYGLVLEEIVDVNGESEKGESPEYDEDDHQFPEFFVTVGHFPRSVLHPSSHRVRTCTFGWSAIKVYPRSVMMAAVIMQQMMSSLLFMEG